jgi:hypothetical protein
MDFEDKVRLTELYRRLSKLHTTLEAVNKGDHYYRQFHTLRCINGDHCPALPLITPNLPLDFIEKELKDVVDAFREYKSKSSVNNL